MARTFDILLTKDESGWWCASVPSLPGCFSQGRTKAEARRNIREAIDLYLEVIAEDKPVVDRFELSAVRAG